MNNDTSFRIAFYIGPIPIYWYSIFMLIGIIVVISLVIFEAKKRKLPIRPLENFAILAIIFGFIGARIWFIIGNHSNIHSFLDVIAVWQGGIAIEGGVFTDLIVAMIYFSKVKMKYDVSMWEYFDIILTNALLCQAIARWGNFFNQEILGPYTSPNSFPLFLLPNFIKDHLHLPSDPSNTYRQPLFLYESFLNFWMWFFLFFVFGRHPWKSKLYKKFNLKNSKHKSIIWLTSVKLEYGSKGIMWFVWYGLIRMILEPFRDEGDILRIGPVPISIVVSAIFFVCGVIFLLINQRKIKWQIWEEKIRIL